MIDKVFVKKIDDIRTKLYKIAYLYVGSEALALDAIDEAVYKGYKARKQLRKEEFFDTWLIRILINECKKILKRQKKECVLDEMPEIAINDYDYDSLPLKEAISKLPQELRVIIILRYFNGLGVVETADWLNIPQGTVATRQKKALKLLRLELEEGDD